MFCPKCGSPNDDNAFKCVQCGTVIQAVPPKISISNYLAPAILSTIFCCLPFGIVAIVNASQVNSKLRAGDYTGAMDSSRKAKIWSWISFAFGFIPLLIFLMGMIGAISIPQFMSYRVKAYDGMAYTTLQNACSTANEILLKNPNETVTLEALIQEGLTISPGVEITIEDGSAQNLTIRSHHQKGRKTYFINIYCNIQELDSTQ